MHVWIRMRGGEGGRGDTWGWETVKHLYSDSAMEMSQSRKRRTETQSGAPEAVTNLDVTHCMPGILLETFSSQETH